MILLFCSRVEDSVYSRQKYKIQGNLPSEKHILYRADIAFFLLLTLGEVELP